MPYDAAGIFGDKRDRKRMICSQGADDEVLRLVTERMGFKRQARNFGDGIFITRALGANGDVHRVERANV